MPRAKKDACNFGCKLDRETFERLEEYCEVSGQNKTFVVEKALQAYIDANLDLMRDVSKRLNLS